MRIATLSRLKPRPAEMRTYLLAITSRGRGARTRGRRAKEPSPCRGAPSGIAEAFLPRFAERIQGFGFSLQGAIGACGVIENRCFVGAQRNGKAGLAKCIFDSAHFRVIAAEKDSSAGIFGDLFQMILECGHAATLEYSCAPRFCRERRARSRSGYARCSLRRSRKSQVPSPRQFPDSAQRRITRDTTGSRRLRSRASARSLFAPCAQLHRAGRLRRVPMLGSPALRANPSEAPRLCPRPRAHARPTPRRGCSCNKTSRTHSRTPRTPMQSSGRS